MKSIYIVLGLVAVGVVAFLVFGRKGGDDTGGSGDTAAPQDGGNFFSSFGQSFGFSQPALGESTGDWILRNNQSGWAFNTKLLK